jgi:hypothetical protein
MRELRIGILIAHDLFGKPIPTFPDHARRISPSTTNGLEVKTKTMRRRPQRMGANGAEREPSSAPT